MKTRKTVILALSFLWIVAAVGAHTRAASGLPESPPDFSVQFTDCVESIGVTLVSTELARAYVPAQFILAGAAEPVTPLVVRTARCGGIVLNGGSSTAGEIVQIGLVVVPPYGTGDINNYTIWYYASDANLVRQLRKAGVNAQHVPTIDYYYDADNNTLFVRIPRPGTPGLVLSGSVQPSPFPAGSFLANWWQQTQAGNVKMSTNVPVINIGGADLTLTTNPNGPLGQLIGGGSTGFPLVQQFNTFTGAHMEVSIVSL